MPLLPEGPVHRRSCALNRDKEKYLFSWSANLLSRVIESDDPGSNKTGKIRDEESEQIHGNIVCAGCQGQAGYAHSGCANHTGSLDGPAAGSADAGTDNKYSLYKGNTLKLDAPYREYFILEDGDAKETILSMRFNADILVRHGIQFTFRNMRHSATQRLVNHYLMADGSKIQDQPGYETMTYNQQFQNRDPRMAQTLMAPGYVDLNGIDEVIEDCKSYDMTGYRFIKFVSDDTHNGATTSTTDWPVFRYPEILLTYAEAKAELGTLTPEDIALTVDVVRDRVGMPALDMTAANNNPDPLMASYYPNVNSGANKGVILEIRRERTVELPCEGLRQWDMLRWKEGAQLVPSSNGLDGFLGCYFPSLGEYDMNGDALSSLGTLAGIGCAYFLGDKWRIADPIAALVVAVFIFKIAFDLIRTGLDELLERSLPEDVEEEILRVVAANPEVREPHNLRTRRIGASIAVEVHVRVDGAMSVCRSHELTEDIERRLRARFGEGTMIAIHVEPLKAACRAE